LEDDAEFDVRGINQFRALLQHLWFNRDCWDVFNGGPHFGSGASDPNLILYNKHYHLFYFRGYATHFTLVHSGAYDKILRWSPANHGPIDSFYFEGANNGSQPLRSICSFPHVAVQSTSPSDVTASVAERMPSFARYSAELLLNEIEKSDFPMNEVTCLKVRHPHWSSPLLLSNTGNVVRMMGGANSFGRYAFQGEQLHIHWYRHGHEVFVFDGQEYIFVETMNSEDKFLLVNAVHPHWEDKLVLSGDARKLITRAASGDTGVYELSADALTVTWDKWPKERFVKRQEVYVFEPVPSPSASKPEIESARHVFQWTNEEPQMTGQCGLKSIVTPSLISDSWLSQTPIFFHNWWANDGQTEQSRDRFFRQILASKLGRYESVHVFSVFGPAPSPKPNHRTLYVQYSGESNWLNPALFDINLIPGDHGGNSSVLPVYLASLYWNGGLNVDVSDFLPLQRRKASRATKFACVVISHGRAPERIDFFQVLSARKKVDSAGRHLCNVISPAPGRYFDKEYIDFLGQYRFVICFENTRQPHYITEKLINAYGAGSIPIYYGCDQAGQLFNSAAFLSIGGQYNETSRNGLIERILSLEENQASYQEVYNQPLLGSKLDGSVMSIGYFADKIRELQL
jgi:hypothetical protein